MTIFASINADYAQLKPTLSGLERFDLDKEPLNNAVLINYLIYFHDLDSFAKLDHIYGGNLHDTIKAIIALAESNRENPFDPIERVARVGPLPAAAQPTIRNRRPASLRSGPCSEVVEILLLTSSVIVQGRSLRELGVVSSVVLCASMGRDSESKSRFRRDTHRCGKETYDK